MSRGFPSAGISISLLQATNINWMIATVTCLPSFKHFRPHDDEMAIHHRGEQQQTGLRMLQMHRLPRCGDSTGVACGPAFRALAEWEIFSRPEYACWGIKLSAPTWVEYLSMLAAVNDQDGGGEVNCIGN